MLIFLLLTVVLARKEALLEVFFDLSDEPEPEEEISGDINFSDESFTVLVTFSNFGGTLCSKFDIHSKFFADSRYTGGQARTDIVR